MHGATRNAERFVGCARQEAVAAERNGKREKDSASYKMRDREPKKDREVEWINERRRVRRKRARINERVDRKMRTSNPERMGKRKMKGRGEE